MSEIKKPKWDKPTSGTATSGSYGTNTIISSPSFKVGKTACTKYQLIGVKTKIIKVINSSHAEAVIIKINSKTETVDNLSVGDHVLINLQDLDYIG